APDSTVAFPGRSWIYRESHLFYALRRALHGAPSPGIVRTASGGTVADFVPLAERVRAHRDEAQRTHTTLTGEVDRLTSKAQPRLDPESLVSLVRDDETHGGSRVEKRALLRAATAHPGDIVTEGFGEGEEDLSLTATASVIAEGARLRAQLIARWWEQNGDDVRASRVEAGALQAKLRHLRVDSNPIAPSIQRVAEQCKRIGANLVVVGLPTDTMVGPEAFAKYGETPVDMSGVSQLADDLRLATEAAGGTWLDLLPALRRLGMSAFLPREFHLSAAGHALVAERLADLIPRLELPKPKEPEAPLGPFAEVRCEGCNGNFGPSVDVDASGVLQLGGFRLKGGVLLPATSHGDHAMLVGLGAGEHVEGAAYGFDVRVGREPDGTYTVAPKPQPGRDEAVRERCAYERMLTEQLLEGRDARTLHVGRHCLDALPASLRSADASAFRYVRNALSAAESTALDTLTEQVLAC
ncbi:MAG: hypothetical protein EOP08_09920, partial [Proteobacteria bacterium]